MPLMLYKKYLAKCPNEAIEIDTFYVSTRQKYEEDDPECFTSNPVGHNVLEQTVRNLCKKPGIDGNFTNHSLRATTVTHGLEKGVPEKLMMARTGHRDRRSLLTYQRPGVSAKQAVSNSFECGGPSFVDMTRNGVKRKCDIVESVMENAGGEKCREASAKIVKIEINNCSGCAFNWS
ncbi:Zinc finger MYM-type 3 [Paramuricea clavata]|uniref:Zinc finger MYM-type 3 n=1 Tax=Paramuricea clavata TaxID=317549 RepID=A0A6S7GID2_PARCT|nr:Zinc finger MYM-type 3 [Paramuricea clavata]